MNSQWTRLLIKIVTSNSFPWLPFEIMLKGVVLHFIITDTCLKGSNYSTLLCKCIYVSNSNSKVPPNFQSMSISWLTISVLARTPFDMFTWFASHWEFSWQKHTEQLQFWICKFKPTIDENFSTDWDWFLLFKVQGYRIKSVIISFRRTDSAKDIIQGQLLGGKPDNGTVVCDKHNDESIIFNLSFNTRLQRRFTIFSLC